MGKSNSGLNIQNIVPSDKFFDRVGRFIIVNYKTKEIKQIMTSPSETNTMHKYINEGWICEGILVTSRWGIRFVKLNEENKTRLDTLHSMYNKHVKEYKNKTMKKVSELIKRLSNI